MKKKSKRNVSLSKEVLDLIKKIEEEGKTIRLEKGNFKNGECIIDDKKVIMINKSLPEESIRYFLESIIKK
jgi:hypothetical protein